MFPCLFGLLAVATIVALRAARLAGLAHLLEERGEGRVSLAGDVFGDLDRLALGGGGGFTGGAHGGVAVGLGHGFADATLFVGREARDHATTIGAGFTDVATGAIAFGLAGAAFTSRLIGLTFGTARLLAARLGLGLAARLAGLAGLTLFHGLTDLFENRGDRRVDLTGGFIGGLAGFLLGFGGGLLGLGGLLMRFLYGRVLIGFLHGLAEALLFVRGEWDRETWVGASFGGRSLGAEVWARGVFGCETEGGEEEQG